MWSKLRTFGLVTLVTVLIWVWADAETQRDDLLRPVDGRLVVGEDVELTLDTLPVLVALPAGNAADWPRVTPALVELKRITIVGPQSVIDRLREREDGLSIAALLTLNADDLRPGTVSKNAELSPSGLGLRFVGPAPMVRVTIAP